MLLQLPEPPSAVDNATADGIKPSSPVDGLFLQRSNLSDQTRKLQATADQIACGLTPLLEVCRSIDRRAFPVGASRRAPLVADQGPFCLAGVLPRGRPTQCAQASNASK